MSTHKDCGEDITWTRREDGAGWAPPMEFVGYHYILTDHPTDANEKVAVRVSCYQPHRCDPEKVLAWLEYKEKLAAIEARASGEEPKMRPWEIKREQLREERWEAALPFACDDCGVDVGEYCISRAKGPNLGKPVLNPHPSRLEKAENGNYPNVTTTDPRSKGLQAPDQKR